MHTPFPTISSMATTPYFHSDLESQQQEPNDGQNTMYPSTPPESMVDSSEREVMIPIAADQSWPRPQTGSLRWTDYLKTTFAPLKRRKRDLLLILFAALFTIPLYLQYAKANSTQHKPTQHVLLNTTQVKPAGPLISRKIWQIFFTRQDADGEQLSIDAKNLVDTPSWIAKNPDYDYTLLGSQGGDNFVSRHYSGNWPVLKTYGALRNLGMKSDFLRYLVLAVEGGVYTDIDTEAYKPIDQWVPAWSRDRTRVVVGIEYDRLDSEFGWADIPHELQFCQWTIAAAPGHPLFAAMTARAVQSLEEIVRREGKSLEELDHVTSFDVMNSTGPAAWTDVVFEHLMMADLVEGRGELTSLRDLSGMTEPRLFGDILVLPIDGFGMGQLHSKSTNDGRIPEQALLRHHFRGSWRDG